MNLVIWLWIFVTTAIVKLTSQVKLTCTRMGIIHKHFKLKLKYVDMGRYTVFPETSSFLQICSKHSPRADIYNKHPPHNHFLSFFTNSLNYIIHCSLDHYKGDINQHNVKTALTPFHKLDDLIVGNNLSSWEICTESLQKFLFQHFFSSFPLLTLECSASFI